MKPYKNQDPIRLVVADVDGTLVTQEKVLTAKTKEAVSQLTAAGIAFAIHELRALVPQQRSKALGSNPGAI